MILFSYFAVTHLENVFKVVPGKAILGLVMDILQVTTEIECALLCQRFPGCDSINFFHRTKGSKTKSLCQLNQKANRASSVTEALYADGYNLYSYKVVT